MPAYSEKMRRTAGMALAVKRGEMPRSRIRGEAVKHMLSMSEDQLSEFASKPVKKTKKKGAK